MSFTCLLIIHDMDQLSKSLKLKFNFTCDISHDKKEELKEPEVKVEEVKEPENKEPEVKK